MTPDRRRVAIIGGGVSGLGAAYALARDNTVTVFEADTRLGGHACTALAGHEDPIPVDMGFIVYNDRNYPNLTRLFENLDVPTKPSNMSFAASFDDGSFEYGLRPSALIAQKRNLLRPAFYRMVRDILKFNKAAHNALTRPDVSLGDFLAELGTSDVFRERYLLPFSGAIWSATPAEMLAFPAATLARFFENHGLLAASGQPAWRTVDGGSKVYVEKLAAAIQARGGELRTGAPVDAVVRTGGPRLKAKGADWEAFDAIVFACHSDQALALLQDPAPAVAKTLGDIRYKANEIILHDDASRMPKRKACWSSWNYIGESGHEPAAIGVTYWMNKLQGLPADRDFFVTLNPEEPIDAHHVFATTNFAHPQFDRAAIAAQDRLTALQGRDGLWFAGAYTRYGFHEDGLASGLNAAAGLGADAPWG